MEASNREGIKKKVRKGKILIDNPAGFLGIFCRCAVLCAVGGLAVVLTCPF